MIHSLIIGSFIVRSFIILCSFVVQHLFVCRHCLFVHCLFLVVNCSFINCLLFNCLFIHCSFITHSSLFRNQRVLFLVVHFLLHISPCCSSLSLLPLSLSSLMSIVHRLLIDYCIIINLHLHNGVTIICHPDGF